MHRANTLLDALVAVVTDLPTTGPNVEQARGYPKSEAPAITVRMARIDPERELSNAFLDNAVDIETIYHVSGDELDAQILQIDAEVYAAIMADRTLGGAVTSTDPKALDFDSSAVSEIPTAAGIRRWRCQLRHSITTTETL